MLKFNDGANWLDERINGVVHAYRIPSRFDSQNPVAVDIGANVGAFPIVNSNKFFKIICFEPSTYSYEECKRNTRKLKNVQVYKFAVSDTSNKTLKLKPYKSSNVSGNASTLDSDWWDESKYELVKTISLEDIYNKLNKIDYLKVDCEGGEYDFLISKDLSKIDYLAIEIHIQLGDKAVELMSYLDKYFVRITESGDGVTMHKEIIYKNRRLL